MSLVGCGPLWRVDGPPPRPPRYGLLQAAGAGGADAVRVNPPGDLVDSGQVERWLNGVAVFPYPPGPAHVWDEMQAGSPSGTKDAGDDFLPIPEFGPFTVYQAESCTARGVWDQEQYRARAVAALAATEGAAVEREFLTGDLLPLNPHLSDGRGQFPLGNTATSAVNALAALEDAIGRTGKTGVVHVTPGFALTAAAHLAVDNKDGVVRTINGTLVVPGAGYTAGGHPTGRPAATGTQEWIYATGPIDVRLTADVVLLPGNVAEAVDRGMGASLGRANRITYRVERYALVVWDTTLQAAVLTDRCQETC